MELSVEIKTIARGTFYQVYDDRDPRNEDICGTGWAIKDAVDDFVDQFNQLSFYDDDNPVLISRDSIELKRIRFKRQRML